MNIINIAKFDSSKFPFHLTKKDDAFVEALLSTEIALAQYNQLLVQMKNGAAEQTNNRQIISK